MIFIIKGFRTIVFIFIVISTTFLSICPPAFFRCLSNSGTFTELRTTSFIESTEVACSDSVSHNRVQVLSTPVLLLGCSQDWSCNLQIIVSLEAYETKAYKRYAMCHAGSQLKKAGGHIGRNVVEITIEMKTIVRKSISFIWFHIETNASCCLFQATQQRFSVGSCICKKRNILSSSSS